MATNPAIDILVRRAAVMRRIRAFFDTRGFIEVETPVRIPSPAPEPHIDCPPCGREFLRASPELQMKKLLAAGMERIYQIGPCFRDGEKGRRHNPEFTMIEWYRRGEDDRAIAADLEALIDELAPGHEPILHLRVRDVYRETAGWDPWESWDADRFDFDMAAKIEPNLPKGPLFLEGYPREAASLAKIEGDTAARWEFYWQGVELANCFTELCDAAEQRKRFDAARAQRRDLGEADYPLDEEFLEILPEIGSAAGVALGIDRLVMLLCGENDISHVRAGC